MREKIAVFHVKFDPDFMIDQETLDGVFGGDWLKFMRQLYADEGMGIFENEVELVEVL